MKQRLLLLIAFLSISFGAFSQVNWTNVGNGLQQRLVNGKLEYRFLKSSGYGAPFGVSDSLLKKADVSGVKFTGDISAPKIHSGDSLFVMNRTLTILGTSITAGTGISSTSTIDSSYANILSKKIGMRLNNRGRSGRFLQQTLPNDSSGYSVRNSIPNYTEGSVYVIELQPNDAGKDSLVYKPSIHRSQLVEIIDVAKTKGYPISRIWFANMAYYNNPATDNYPNNPQRHDQYSLVEKQVCDSIGINFYDAYYTFTKTKLNPDSVHPTNAGHAEIAANFYAEMVSKGIVPYDISNTVGIDHGNRDVLNNLNVRGNFQVDGFVYGNLIGSVGATFQSTTSRADNYFAKQYLLSNTIPIAGLASVNIESINSTVTGTIGGGQQSTIRLLNKENTANSGSDILWSGYYNGTSTYPMGSIGIKKVNGAGTGSSNVWADIIFRNTSSTSAYNTEKMRLNYLGNLLIGTTTDIGKKLTVNGIVNASGTPVSANDLIRKTDLDAAISAVPTNFIQNQTATPQSGGFNVTATTFHQGGIQTNEFVRYMRGSYGVDIQSPASLSNYYTQLLQALNGTLALTVQPGDIEITDATKGIILKSPNGTRWRVTVGDTGVLTTTSIP